MIDQKVLQRGVWRPRFRASSARGRHIHASAHEALRPVGALAEGAPLPILIKNCWGERGGQSMKEAAYGVGFAVSFACVVAGCATSSIGEVHEIEPGTYTIDVPRSYATVVASPDKEIIDAAVRKAGAYCHAKGLVLSVRSAVANRIAFQCVPGEPSR